MDGWFVVLGLTPFETVFQSLWGRMDGWKDKRTDGEPDPYIMPCQRQARQKE